MTAWEITLGEIFWVGLAVWLRYRWLPFRDGFMDLVITILVIAVVDTGYTYLVIKAIQAEKLIQ